MSVATLRAGQEVEGIFACTRKDRLLSRGGTPYLAVELRDRTGAVQGRAFRDADVLGRRFERGDLEACQLHPRLDADLLVAAALVHDVGKTREFTYGAEIGVTDAGRLLGHVELGLALLRDRAAREPALDGGRFVALAHCVLCHHGPDAASGRRFCSAERSRCIASTRSTRR